MKSLRITLMVFGCWIAAWAQAVEVKELYKASVVVADRSNENLRHGSQEALAEIVIRVSGDSTAMESYDITQAMSSPARYIEQYGYERTAIPNESTGLPEPAYKLNITFNAHSINRLIRQAGLPIWASNRAEVLIWLVIEDESGRRIVNRDTAPEIVAQLEQLAAQRGLPIAFPLNDLQDQLAVSSSDVWGMFMDRISQASTRYAPGAILAGKVYPPTIDTQNAAWTFLLDGKQHLVESQGLSLAEALSPAVDMSADMLAQKYAVVMGGGDTDFVWLNVQGVQSLTDFAQLTAYLEKLVAVKQANMDQLQEDKTRFRVYLESDIENLKQLLMLDNKLIEIPQQPEPPSVVLTADTPIALVPLADPTTPAIKNAEVNQVPPVMEQHSIPELSYHWHRTYMSNLVEP